MYPFENLTEGINPLLRLKHRAAPHFVVNFSWFLNLLQLLSGLHPENTVGMGDAPEPQRRTCSVEKTVKGKGAVFGRCDMWPYPGVSGLTGKNTKEAFGEPQWRPGVSTIPESVKHEPSLRRCCWGARCELCWSPPKGQRAHFLTVLALRVMGGRHREFSLVSRLLSAELLASTLGK